VEEEEEEPPLPAPFASSGTIMLTTERILATSRLVELAEGMRASIDDPPPIEEILDNIHTSRVGDIDALEHALAFAIPPMLAQRRLETYSPLLGERIASPEDRPRRQGRGFKPIRLLIVDSITALLRGNAETERSSSSLTQRSRYLCSVADRLKALAVEYELAVVVVNQVKDVFAPGFGVGLPITSNLPGVSTLNGAEGVTRLTTSAAPSSQASEVDAALPPMLYATQARHFSGQSSGVAKEAALGIVWANAMNARLMLSRTGRRRNVSDDDLRGVKRARNGHPPPPPVPERDEKELLRRFHLVFSPYAPPAMIDYVILGDGIRTLPASLRLMDLGPAIRRRDARLRAALEEPLLDEMPGPHLGSDIYDEMDIPPELWEGLDADVEDEAPSSPVAVGVVD
jgi:DNA repair protein RAD57